MCPATFPSIKTRRMPTERKSKTPMAPQPSGPFTGIRVLDLTSVVFGPLCTQVLGDQGADVIKIEGPEGDTTRDTGPQRSPRMAAVFMGLNRSKRSLVLDLKQQAAKDALWRLIDGADVLVHSIRPQAIARLGFSPEAVLARNPKIIYAALTGFRSGGPYAGQPAYDDVIQGMSGAVDLMSSIAGEPRYAPMIFCDKTCGMVGAQAISAALFARARSGQGQAIEVSMLETMVAYNFAEHMFGHNFVPPAGQIGYSRVLAPWRRPYKTQDGYICMLAYTDGQWRKFWPMAGRAELTADPRFATMKARADNIAELYRLAGECMTGRTSAEWLKALSDAEIPCGPVNRLEDLATDPHLSAIGFFREVEHPTEGTIRLVDLPVRYEATPGAVQRLQPHLGEHSVEILGEAGLGERDIAAMLAAGATVDGRPALKTTARTSGAKRKGT